MPEGFPQIFGSPEGQQRESFDRVNYEAPPEERELVERAMNDIADATGPVNRWQEKAREWRRYYHSHQWDDVDRMRMEQLRRPAIEFNEIKPAVDAVSGLERLNRMEVRYVSRPLDSEVIEDAAGDLATEAVQAVLQESNGDDERSRAIKDMAITGIGATESRMDYEERPGGKLMLERLDNMEVVWDHRAIKENLEDRRWCARRRQMPLDSFKARWPDKLDEVQGRAPEYTENRVEKYELVTPYYSRANQEANPRVGTDTTGAPNSIEVIQYQWREVVTVYRFLDPDSPRGIGELKDEQFQTLKRRLREAGIEPPKGVRSQRAVYKQCYIANGVLLEKPTELPGEFSINFITGEWDPEDEVWYGIVKILIDPQKTMNKAMSSAITFLITNAKGGVMFEPDAFLNPDLAKSQWSRPDAWIPLQEKGAEKIVQRQNAQFPMEIKMFFEESRRALHRVAGMSEELLSIASGDVQSSTAKQRVQSALAVLAWFFDNVNRYRRTEARVMLEFIREYWSYGQYIRVGGEFNAQAVPLLSSDLPLEYDLVIDESVKHNPNLKAQVWNDIQPLIPQLIRFGYGKFLLQVLRYSPLPTKLVADLHKEAQQNPPGEQQKGRGKQEDPQETMAKIKKTLAQAEHEMAQAEKTKAEVGMAKAEPGLEAAELALKAIRQGYDIKDQEKTNQTRELSQIVSLAKLILDAYGKEQPSDGRKEDRQGSSRNE